MSLLRHRGIGLLCLALLVLSGLARHAPALCCPDDDRQIAAREAALQVPADTCCPSSEESGAQEPAPNTPCGDRESCPMACCEVASEEIIPPVPARSGFEQFFDTAAHPVTSPETAPRLRPVTPPVLSDAPVSHSGVPLHLRLQVFLC